MNTINRLLKAWHRWRAKCYIHHCQKIWEEVQQDVRIEDYRLLTMNEDEDEVRYQIAITVCGVKVDELTEDVCYDPDGFPLVTAKELLLKLKQIREQELLRRVDAYYRQMGVNQKQINEWSNQH